MVGLFGGVIFSPATYLTKDMKVHASSDWVEHKVLGNIPVLERTGGECMTFQMNLTFNRKHTMTYEAGMALLSLYAKSGLYFPLIIGGVPIGPEAPNFVITKVEGDYSIVTPMGRTIHGTANVEFKQYRVSVQPQSAPNAGSNSLTSPLGQVAAAVSGVASSVGGIVNSVIGTLGAVGGIVGGISNITGAVGAVSGVVGAVTGLAGNISGPLSSLVGASGTLSGIINNVGHFVTSAGGIVTKVTQTAAIGGAAVQNFLNVPNSIVGVANTFGALGGYALASGALSNTLVPSGIRIAPTP